MQRVGTLSKGTAEDHVSTNLCSPSKAVPKRENVVSGSLFLFVSVCGCHITCHLWFD